MPLNDIGAMRFLQIFASNSAPQMKKGNECDAKFLCLLPPRWFVVVLLHPPDEVFR